MYNYITLTHLVSLVSTYEFCMYTLLLDLAFIQKETQRHHRQEPYVSHSETTGSSILLINIYVITALHKCLYRDCTNVEISVKRFS